VICNFAKQCNSLTCVHKGPHTQMEKWCEQGSCKWSSECRCVPETKRERLMALINDYHTTFVPMTDEYFANRIEEIYAD
jgi:hypothetical protein